MTNAIEINGLAKEYKGFSLDGISFCVPRGYICGFIGQNGAGKTTTLKLMLGMAHRERGEVQILEKPGDDVSVKEDLGVLFDQPFFQGNWTPTDAEKAMRPFYKRWDSELYHSYLQRFNISPKQKFKTLSRGMKMKLGMAAALSHDAELLLLDEPTSGLDPVMRDEMLGILQDYMTKESRSIFFSTHITHDLEKIADYIVYIHEGKILYSGLMDELLERYCLVRGGQGDLLPAKRKCVIGLREHVGGFEGMVNISDIAGFPSGVITEPASLEDIMVFMSRKGEHI